MFATSLVYISFHLKIFLCRLLKHLQKMFQGKHQKKNNCLFCKQFLGFENPVRHLEQLNFSCKDNEYMDAMGFLQVVPMAEAKKSQKGANQTSP